MKPDRELEARLRRHRPARPDDALRPRVLTAAGAAVSAGEVPTAPWVERLWLSSRARIAWAAAVLLLLLAQVVVSRGVDRRLDSLFGTRGEVARTAALDAARELGLGEGWSHRLRFGATAVDLSPRRAGGLQIAVDEIESGGRGEER